MKRKVTERFRRWVVRHFGFKGHRFFVSVKALLPNLSCAAFPMNREIILESLPDLACNSYEVFRCLLRRGVNKDYRLTWLVDDPESFADVRLENVSFLPMHPKSRRERIRVFRRLNRAAAILCSNRHVQRSHTSRRQVNIYLDHGSQLKRVSNDLEKFVVLCDYVLVQSDFFIPYTIQEYPVTEDQIIACGLPRNDQFFNPCDNLKSLVPDADRYKKILLWVPTFRRIDSKHRVDCDADHPMGIPVVSSPEDILRLDETLRENETLLLIKPHPAQDVDQVRAINCPNLRFLTSEDLRKAGIQLNELLAQTDAMITDYSSIYYDYLLRDRPIAITLDDYEYYRDQKGFVFEDPLEILKGEYLYTVDDFRRFIEGVRAGKDDAREERNRVKEMVHSFYDNHSADRVCDFLLEKLKERGV